MKKKKSLQKLAEEMKVVLKDCGAVGFMSSVGYSCERVKGTDKFKVMRRSPVKFLGHLTKDEFYYAILRDGFDPTDLLKPTEYLGFPRVLEKQVWIMSDNTVKSEGIILSQEVRCKL